jgi:hypothetical protein
MDKYGFPVGAETRVARRPDHRFVAAEPTASFTGPGKASGSARDGSMTGWPTTRRRHATTQEELDPVYDPKGCEWPDRSGQRATCR